MGNFSWDCKVCGASLHRAWQKGDPDAWQEDALLFAANGVTARGKYNGYGKIGRFQIPQEWMHDDIAFWTLAIQRDEEFAQRDTADAEWLERVNALLVKCGEPPFERPARTPRPVDPDPIDCHAELAKALVENIRFTVYHRRCWENAGRPGFAGQSRPSEDQGR